VVGGGSSPGKGESGSGCFESGEVTAAPPVGCGHNVEGGGSESCVRFGHEKRGTGKKGAMADSFYTTVVGRGWWRGGGGPVGRGARGGGGGGGGAGRTR
jgi:hypothetical protein